MNISSLLAIIILLTASLGQLNRLFIGDIEGSVLYANDLLVGVLAVLYIGYVLIVRKSWKIPPLFLFSWLFLVFGGLGLAINSPELSGTQLLVSLSYWLRFVCYSFLFFITYDAVVYAKATDQNQNLKRWLFWIIVTMVLVAASGFIQLYILPDLAVLARYGWDPHIGRLTTAMLDPNYASAYLSMGVAVCVALYFYVENARMKVILLLITALLLTAVLLTYSRSGYLMLGAVLGVIAVFKSRWLLVVGIVVALMAFILIPRVQQRVIGAFEIDASAQPRIISWQNSYSIAEDNQPFGVGFNSYRYAQVRYGIVELEESGNAGAGADSSWLFILATSGITGLLAFTIFYFGMAWQSWKGVVFGRSPLVQSVCLSFLAILAGLFIFSQFNNALFYTWILQIFWVLAGLVHGATQVMAGNSKSKVSNA